MYLISSAGGTAIGCPPCSTRNKHRIIRLEHAGQLYWKNSAKMLDFPGRNNRVVFLNQSGRQLTTCGKNASATRHPVVFVAVGRSASGTVAGRVWRVNADGTNLKELSEGNDAGPECWRGKWVYYFNRQTNGLKRISVDGGKPEDIPGQESGSRCD